MPRADVFGHRALLFINNPHASTFVDPTGMGKHYDIVTDPAPTGYSVPVNAVSVGDGDVGVVYRVDGGAHHRDPGKIVAVARITTSPWRNRWGEAGVNWEVMLLPPEEWVTSQEMKASGLWMNRVPLTQQNQASSPVQLDLQQWQWLTAQLPTAAVDWLETHAKGPA